MAENKRKNYKSLTMTLRKYSTEQQIDERIGEMAEEISGIMKTNSNTGKYP